MTDSSDFAIVGVSTLLLSSFQQFLSNACWIDYYARNLSHALAVQAALKLHLKCLWQLLKVRKKNWLHQKSLKVGQLMNLHFDYQNSRS